MKRKIKLFAIATTLVTATALIAGGFALQIGKPSANPEAQAKNAVLVVRGYACVASEQTTLTATAEGIVNGKRETIPLKLIPLSGTKHLCARHVSGRQKASGLSRSSPQILSSTRSPAR